MRLDFCSYEQNFERTAGRMRSLATRISVRTFFIFLTQPIRAFVYIPSWTSMSLVEWYHMITISHSTTEYTSSQASQCTTKRSYVFSDVFELRFVRTFVRDWSRGRGHGHTNMNTPWLRPSPLKLILPGFLLNILRSNELINMKFHLVLCSFVTNTK